MYIAEICTPHPLQLQAVAARTIIKGSARGGTAIHKGTKLLVFLLLVTLGGLAYRLWVQHQRLAWQVQHIQRLERKLTGLQDSLRLLRTQTRTLRALAGLPQDPTPEEPIGTGGLELPPDPVQRHIYLADETLDRLLALTRYELTALQNVQQALEEQQDHWARIPSILPTRGYITSGYGYRTDPFTGRIKFHHGVDIFAPRGTPVVAPARGRVYRIRRERGYGLTLELDHGNGIHTFFAHLQSVKVHRGQIVDRGDTIALVGNTGRSTGPHLHYEVRVQGKRVNPRRYIIPDYALYE